MTVCANRSDDPGFFTPCKQCPCGAAVKAELEAQVAPVLDNQENP